MATIADIDLWRSKHRFFKLMLSLRHRPFSARTKPEQIFRNLTYHGHLYLTLKEGKWYGKWYVPTIVTSCLAKTKTHDKPLELCPVPCNALTPMPCLM